MDEKPFGPLQRYVFPEEDVAARFIVSPTQSKVSPITVGFEVTITFLVTATFAHPLTVRIYYPE